MMCITVAIVTIELRTGSDLKEYPSPGLSRTRKQFKDFPSPLQQHYYLKSKDEVMRAHRQKV